MKSPMVMIARYMDDEEKARYGDLEVLRSAAGWYIGTVYQNPEGFLEPGSRDTGYFETEEEAINALQAMENGTYTGTIRMMP